MDTDSLVDEISTELQTARSADIADIDHRVCSSDRFDGVSLTITGSDVPIRPIMSAVGNLEAWRIEQIGMYNDAYRDTDEDGNTTYSPGLVVFCACIEKSLELLENDIFV